MSKKLFSIVIGLIAVLAFSVFSLAAIGDPEYALASNGLKFLGIVTVLSGVFGTWGVIKLSGDVQDEKLGQALRDRAFESLKAKADLFASKVTIHAAYLWFLARLILVVGLLSTGAVWFAVLVTFIAFLKLTVVKLLFKAALPGADKESYLNS